MHCIFDTFMTSLFEKKISAEVRVIHAEQMSLYNFIVLRKKQQTQLKTAQLKQDILNQWESMGFSKLSMYKSSSLEVFIEKSVLKICSKFTGEHPCQSVISIKLQSNFIEVILQNRCSPVNLLNNFRTLFPKNTSGLLPLYV